MTKIAITPTVISNKIAITPNISKWKLDIYLGGLEIGVIPTEQGVGFWAIGVDFVIQ